MHRMSRADPPVESTDDPRLQGFFRMLSDWSPASKKTTLEDDFQKGGSFGSLPHVEDNVSRPGRARGLSRSNTSALSEFAVYFNPALHNHTLELQYEVGAPPPAEVLRRHFGSARDRLRGEQRCAPAMFAT